MLTVRNTFQVLEGLNSLDVNRLYHRATKRLLLTKRMIFHNILLTCQDFPYCIKGMTPPPILFTLKQTNERPS